MCRNSALKIMALIEVRFETYRTFFVDVRGTGEVTQDGDVSVAERHVVDF